MVTLKIYDDAAAHKKAVEELMQQGLRFSSWAENVQVQKLGTGNPQTLHGKYAILVDDDL